MRLPLSSQRRPKEAVTILTGIPEVHAGRTAIIYRPARHAMQSGSAATKKYRLEFPHQGRWKNPLMGWASTRYFCCCCCCEKGLSLNLSLSSSDALGNVSLYFDTEEEAVDFCDKQAFEYQLDGAKPHERTHQSYADNFAFQRKKVPDELSWRRE